MPAQAKILRYYVTPVGKKPIEDWLQSLRDQKTRARIRTRLNRLRLGNTGDSKSVGDGIHELRIHLGPGYRVYYADVEGFIVILLCGGDKSTQSRDIQRAKQYWRELRSRSHE